MSKGSVNDEGSWEGEMSLNEEGLFNENPSDVAEGVVVLGSMW